MSLLRNENGQETQPDRGARAHSACRQALLELKAPMWNDVAGVARTVIYIPANLRLVVIDEASPE